MLLPQSFHGPWAFPVTALLTWSWSYIHSLSLPLNCWSRWNHGPRSIIFISRALRTITACSSTVNVCLVEYIRLGSFIICWSLIKKKKIKEWKVLERTLRLTQSPCSKDNKHRHLLPALSGSSAQWLDSTSPFSMGAIELNMVWLKLPYVLFAVTYFIAFDDSVVGLLRQ